jgi:arylsulfate sulfotransferase
MLNPGGGFFALFAMVLPVYGTISVTLSSSPSSPQPVGNQIQWMATATDSQSGTLLYQWQVGVQGQMSSVVRDYYTSNLFAWTPTQNEGNYQITVTVMNESTGNTASAMASFTVTSNVTGSAPVVLPTSHPLVALYSAPPCASGSYMRVVFEPASGSLQVTPWKPCAAGLSMNFEVGGMRASTTYYMVHQIVTSGTVTNGPVRSFTTGALPTTLPFPASSVTVGPSSQTDEQAPIILQCNITFPGSPQTMPIATDLSGRVLWYYAPFAAVAQEGTSIYRPLPGGNMVMAANDPTTSPVETQILREIDLEGNALLETNVPRVSAQLVAVGQDPITSFSHDIIQLPNGHLMALATNERLLTNVQGSGTVDVIGNMLVELDQNLQVVWSWNAFDYLDTSRMATLHETCTVGQSGCPPVTLAAMANDWLHANSVNYSSTDGNLIISLRNQDWVIKIDYQNGSGSGNVIWRLGLDGDFTLIPDTTDPYPWFSHQHDAEYDIPGKPLMSVFDNGNVRKVVEPNADSRGQAYWLDEATLTAYQVLSADLGTFSYVMGNAQLLQNGNFAFGLGVITTTPVLSNGSPEVLENATIDYDLQTSGVSYRNFRMYSMYAP